MPKNLSGKQYLGDVFPEDISEEEAYEDECEWKPINMMAPFEFNKLEKQDMIQQKMGPCPTNRFYVGRRPGLNIKVICENEKCPSHRNNDKGGVWIQKGFGVFHLER